MERFGAVHAQLALLFCAPVTMAWTIAYLRAGLPLAEVLRTQGLCFIVLSVTEIPTSWFADRVSPVIVASAAFVGLAAVELGAAILLLRWGPQPAVMVARAAFVATASGTTEVAWIQHSRRHAELDTHGASRLAAMATLGLALSSVLGLVALWFGVAAPFLLGAVLRVTGLIVLVSWYRATGALSTRAGRPARTTIHIGPAVVAGAAVGVVVGVSSAVFAAAPPKLVASGLDQSVAFVLQCLSLVVAAVGGHALVRATRAGGDTRDGLVVAAVTGILAAVALTGTWPMLAGIFLVLGAIANMGEAFLLPPLLQATPGHNSAALSTTSVIAGLVSFVIFWVIA
jgi:hypothetical protein